MAECWECGREMTEMPVDFILAIKGEEYNVSSMGYKCECGYKTIVGSQLDGFNIALADAYRRKYGLYTTAELLAFRKEFGFSQQSFADLLENSVQTIKKWEHGGVQDRSMNELIRLKVDEYRKTRKSFNAGYSKRQHYSLLNMQPEASENKKTGEVNPNVNSCDSTKESQSFAFACGC